MSEAPKRRWFRFSLRTMFVAMTACTLIFWLAWNIEQVREREQVLIMLDSQSVMFGDYPVAVPRGSMPLIWKLLGAKRIDLIKLPRNFNEEQMSNIKYLFPEAIVAEVPPLVDIPPELWRALEITRPPSE